MAKEKLKYSFLNNIKFVFGNMWQWDSKATVLTLLRAPFMVAAPFLGIYLSRSVVSFIETGTEINAIAINITALCALLALSKAMPS